MLQLLRKAVGAAAASLFVITSSVVVAQAKTELTVYTAHENDDLAAYKKAFEKDNPDIVINWVRDSTGVITAKLMAEKDNPRADVVWGLAVTSMDCSRRRDCSNPMPRPISRPSPPNSVIRHSPLIGSVIPRGFARSSTTKSKAKSAKSRPPKPG
jgi:hypothetical protein